jgi:AraC-like DNA-binding protein
VTSDAKRSVSGATPGDFVLSGIVRELVDAADGQGITRAALIAEIGLTAEELADPDGLVPFEAYIRAWEVLAAIPGNDEIGLRMGESSAVEHLGALGYAMIHAQSALAALELFRRYRRLASDTFAPAIDIDGEHVVIHLVWPVRLARLSACADSALAGAISILRALAGLARGAPLAVEAWYQCPRPSGVDRAAALGCRVRYGAPEMRLVLRRELLEQPLPTHNPALVEYLSRHTQAIVARIPESALISDRVRRVITENLQNGEPAQAEVSRKLALSERTLQRRLRDEATTFAAILNDVRHELSQHYLASSDLTLHEVAFLLGYSEPSAFHRAFRRWTGETPQAFRLMRLAATGRD